ncbi:hypothetical protein TPHA_0F01710 [Tetrapisispora phaffii CBS 4417]|uniref:DNA polymerase n=1 Tax=Tetrapisispora phaffii (strain ATCC 24235 / CBS 4417 / NBRC 1672 / NRRL Y-8282 / UCD 70-5) TaxID=1071381 RepID=G8BV73_TETPH|nr:hypothetical protein TPHA_0F01710 [Tetrapisispora phaffii CBS 4417]CCE63655.1 hypothetical protein TPHA_0F01710 [Tetrapisispora phaffii CBS 4417]
MTSNQSRLEKLKKLQAARNGGQASDDVEYDDVLYDELDENEYRSRKRQELLQDDFVVDDDGLGYVDRGVGDDWDNRDEYYTDEEDIVGNQKNSKKKPLTEKDTKSIENIIRAQNSKISISNQLNKPKKNFGVADFDDILDEFNDSNEEKMSFRTAPKVNIPTHSKLPSSPTISNKRIMTKDVEVQEDGKQSKKLKTEEAFIHNSKILQISSSPLKSKSNMINTSKEESETPVPSSPTATKSEKIIQKLSEDDSDSDEEIAFGRRTMRSAKSTRKINLSSKTNLGSSPFVTAPGTPLVSKAPDTPSKTGIDTQSIPDTESLVFKKYDKEQIIDPETNGFKMFWLDFSEVDSKLIIFGLVRALDGSLLSAMVQINGLARELFFLPREGVEPEEVQEEIVPLLLEKYGLDKIRSKPQEMKYAFEIPGIPHVTNYLKVLLPFDTPKSKRDIIPSDLNSEKFSHVFGGGTGILESFLVQNKIMGPCWLDIKNGDFETLQNTSHCKLEISVSNPSDIKPIEDSGEVFLKCMSLSVQTVMNRSENKQEVVAITMATYNRISPENAIPENINPDQLITLVRPPKGTSFPLGLAPLAKQKLNGQVRLFNNEKTLLACFCAMLRVSDPDVLIGHRLENVILDVLSHRIWDFKIPNFSSLGRRNRREWPARFGKQNFNMNNFLIKDISSGRLLCDIANEMGQSLTPKCQNWDLSEMYTVTTGIEHKSIDINYQNTQYHEDVNSMIMALQENVNNVKLTAEVSFRIQLLSLTKQLTNLAGNAWSQTLGGTRAGRNEYILLHEFVRNGYIVPDKESNKSRARKNVEHQETEGNNSSMAPAVSSKKAKYQGGLVFEPEKGLHKNYILVMDFNSLYPSIIQEFNICFTTVDRNLNDIEEIPEVPSSEKEQGVLPRLLQNLVQRRREVKKLMINESDPHIRAQCDIRQQALKLTANSMYGCLGYVNSRFYAKPLAMLVTGKGREILMNTRQLAESMNLKVVYGDTDSVMIDTGSELYGQAIAVGLNFKKLVNERYKLLEIDIDNVFKKLLLHSKKKYAALNVTIDKNKQEQTSLEVKGLDMRRREYCPLSKEVSTNILNLILSDKDSETALQEIYDYLEDIKSKVENNEIRVDKYKINTKLSKDPSAYPGGKSMPAVQVALHMRKAGRVVKAGSVITFVITKEKEDENKSASTTSPAERAFSLNEVMVKTNNLLPDPNYYLEKQIFAPVERLLENIESFDIVRLSSALGLDSRKYLQRVNEYGNGANGIDNLQPLETTISDVERFKDTAFVILNCPSCDNEFPFGGIVASNYYTVCFNGIQCKKCEHIFSTIQFTSQLERCIRSHISLYYAGWLHCDDRTCGNVTRQISVFGKRCLMDGCTGVMRYRYTDKQLYNQLLYFDSLFDCKKIKNRELKPLYQFGDIHAPKEPLNELTVNALTEQNRELFQINHDVVQKYLNDCGRRYVHMGSIFEFMTM